MQRFWEGGGGVGEWEEQELETSLPFCVACCFVCVRRVLLLLLLSQLLVAIWLRDDRSSRSRNASLPSLVVGGVTVARRRDRGEKWVGADAATTHAAASRSSTRYSHECWLPPTTTTTMIPPPLPPPAAADFCLQRFCRTLLRFSLSLSLSRWRRRRRMSGSLRQQSLPLLLPIQLCLVPGAANPNPHQKRERENHRETHSETETEREKRQTERKDPTINAATTVASDNRRKHRPRHNERR